MLSHILLSYILFSKQCKQLCVLQCLISKWRSSVSECCVYTVVICTEIKSVSSSRDARLVSIMCLWKITADHIKKLCLFTFLVHWEKKIPQTYTKDYGAFLVYDNEIVNKIICDLGKVTNSYTTKSDLFALAYRWK